MVHVEAKVINIHFWFDRKLRNIDALCFSRSPLLSVRLGCLRGIRMQTKVEFTKVSVPTIALCIGMSWGLAGLFWFQKLLCFWFLHFGRPVRWCCLPLLEYCYHPALWFQLLIDRNRKFLLQVKVCSIYRHNTKCTFIIYIYVVTPHP